MEAGIFLLYGPDLHDVAFTNWYSILLCLLASTRKFFTFLSFIANNEYSNKIPASI